MRRSLKIFARSSEKGFTLLESLIVVGLTSLLAIGVVAAYMEGLDTLQNVTDTQSVEFGQQRAMLAFMDDVHAATWFYNGTVPNEGGGEVLRPNTNPFYLIVGYPGPDGDEVWVRYKIRYGSFSFENYLMRTVLTSSGADEGSTILTTGVSNLEFYYYTAEGKFTDQIEEVAKVVMVLSINVGGTTVQREYEAALRNPNMGAKDPPGDFDEVETANFVK
jgi:type II secretory pathway pseudopilin PulG